MGSLMFEIHATPPAHGVFHTFAWVSLTIHMSYGHKKTQHTVTNAALALR